MSDELDVLVITQFFPPESMGGAHRWKELAANLDESIEPHILCTHPTYPFGEFDREWRPLTRETVNDVPVTRLFTYQPLSDSTVGRILNYGIFSVLSSLYVLCTFWRYDCVVTMSTPHTTFVPGLVSKLLGRRWFIDIFDLWIDNAADLGYVDEDSVAYRLVSGLERISFATTDGVFVITETMAEYYEDKYPNTDFDVHVIPFGVDTEMFSPDVEPTISTDVIYTGNLGTGQAFIPFFEGFARLEGEPEMTIVGDGERREELEALTEELGIADRVSFEGYVDREEIPGLLAGATVALVPLKTEYQLDYARPTKLLESMAVGTPYVASSVKEIKYLSQQYNTGIVVENRPQQIHNGVNTVLENTQKGSEMEKNGVKLIQCSHNWADIGEKAADVMRSIE